MLDLLIRGGLVIDGSGNPGYYGAVGVEGDSVRIFRGDVSEMRAGRYIDATGHVVCPGFIDVHSHGGLVILGEPRHEPKVRQGITTELIGIDGNSVAPFKNEEELWDFIELDSGLNGRPPRHLTWASVAEFLSLFDNKVSVNIAYILGNSPVRIWAVGWDNRPADGAQLEDMKAVVREAMEEGAFGLSTGLDYPPGSFASTEELIELSKVAAAKGGFYHTHTRAALRAKGLLAPWEEALEIGLRSGAPVHLTHYRQPEQGTGSHSDFIGLVERARDEGMDVTYDCYSYIYSGTRAVACLPQWTQDGGLERLRQNLRSRAARDRMRKELSSGPRRRNPDETWLTNFEKPHNKQYEGLSISQIARLRRQDEVDTLCDLFLDDGMQVSMVGIGTNAQTLPAFVAHPAGMFGSDALLLGDYPSPRTYGCFPVVLAEFVRAERQLTLEAAIRKMTSFAAQRLGLLTRGLLRDGMRADIVVFDPRAVKAPATKSQPKQFPLGIPYVIVNGQVVIDDGRHTGATPGRALRHGKD